MEDICIWARRPINVRYATEKIKPHVRYTWAGPIDQQLYSDSLIQLSKNTEQNLALLARSRHQPYTALPNELHRKSHYEQSSLSDFGLVFAPRDTFSSLARSASLDSDASSIDSVSGPVSHCYLCSTLDQHHKHLLTLRVSKKPPKPRVCYIAPQPRVRSKLIEELPASFDSRYKVVVWTGNKPGAATSSNIYITIKGDEDILHKTRLCPGHAKNKKFYFCQGAKDVFYVKSPELGNLETLTIELESDGLKRSSWYCDKIEVMCLKTSRCWLFECKNWLSLHHGDYKLVRDLRAVNIERNMQEFELMVTTGSKNLAGTDANVYVTFYGTNGSSPKIQLVAENSEKVFQRSSVDTFQVRFTDIGEIRSLRIEHDGSGFASGWFLENMVMKDLKDPKTIYYFLHHGWLAKDRGDGRLWREIKAVRKLAKEITSAKLRRRLEMTELTNKYKKLHSRTGPYSEQQPLSENQKSQHIVIDSGENEETSQLVKYRVTVQTGDVRYAGTDANVYIIIQGTQGKTKKLFMNDDRNNFEKGKTEDFELKAFNTGPVTSIRIGHDNRGPGSGWYCEDVTLKKYFCREEQVQFLNKLKKRTHPSKRLSKGSLKELKNDEENGDKDGDDQEEENYRHVFDVDGRVTQIPYYEEYYFECKAWFAKDEGDGLVERELDVKKKTVIFKKR